MQHLEQWTNFWQQGFPTSFAQVLPNSYIGKTGEYWRSTVSGLHPNSKVLDIACGNGAVALLIADEASKSGKPLEIHAADAANITPLATNKNPRHQETLKKLNFHSCMEIEKIHSLDEKFSLITSQFGFEYSNKVEAATSIEKSLEPGGMFKAICHKTNSKPYKDCSDEVSAHKLVIEDLKILEKTTSLIHDFEDTQSTEKAKIKLGNPHTAEKLKRLIASVEMLISKHPKSATTFFVRNSLESFLQKNLTSSNATKDRFLSFFDTELKYTALRSQNQLDSSLSDRDMNNLIAVFERLGMQLLTRDEFYDENSCTGWKIEFLKP
ncbi:class I SAM-dependent methyltransferase [Microbulbifer sp. JMSA004]|uniref:class I SAM-dependent methyltransferase n=1 Tax=unclassified Microbulbifer TaxID=2619833 RepID=UPI0024ADB625|nr:class I SAM-dependent methyltransferase [Microbulbifer sp. VAAF005]WHI47461.1 class I SAM-dependent methyltransferase [Microbulbifer sp. VAAF005]